MKLVHFYQLRKRITCTQSSFWVLVENVLVLLSSGLMFDPASSTTYRPFCSACYSPKSWSMTLNTMSRAVPLWAAIEHSTRLNRVFEIGLILERNFFHGEFPYIRNPATEKLSFMICSHQPLSIKLWRESLL